MRWTESLQRETKLKNLCPCLPQAGLAGEAFVTPIFTLPDGVGLLPEPCPPLEGVPERRGWILRLSSNLMSINSKPTHPKSQIPIK
jgi:hypothetical protein